MKKLLSILIFLCSLASAQQITSYGNEYFPDIYGGRAEWKRFVHDQMVYPGFDLTEKFEGTVKIYFKINKAGKAVQQKITESVSTGIDNEALRLLNLLEWQAPTAEDSILNVGYSLAIQFPLNKYKKWVKERGYVTTPYADLPADSSFAVYEAADKPASFADKEKTFTEFVYSNLEYPEMARQQTIEGNVIMTFIVEPNGSTSNIRIKKGLSGGCNDEATRVIGLTKWKPAQRNGKYVRYRMYYTMVFKLQSNLKDGASGSQRAWGQ